MTEAGNAYDNLLASLRIEFAEEAEDNLSTVEALLENVRAGQESREGAIDGVRRPVHSLKGSSSVADFPLVTVVMHRLEDYLNGLKHLEDSHIDDIQIFIDRAREYSSVDVDQHGISISDFVRQLPDRHVKHIDPKHKVIEALLVVRERTAGMLFERELRASWLRVTTVRSSFEAIEMAVRMRPDVIICSGVIDSLSGIDVACALKAMSVTKEIPIGLLTSFEKDHHELDGLPADVHLIQKSHLSDNLRAFLEENQLVS